MKEVTREQLIKTFRALGLQAGDGLLVHSALQFLGRPVGGINIYLEALADVICLDQGTLAVPAFNFGFAKGIPFDPQTTPSTGMGQFSELVRQQPGARRTCHPLQSLAVLGKYAEDLAGRDTPSAFDPGSAFDRMVELKFKILLLGADIDAVSLIHYSEQRLGVPYRYWKAFTGLVKNAGAWEQRTYRMYVRDLVVDPHLTLHPVRDALLEDGLFQTVGLNYGWVSLLEMTDLVAYVDRFLSADPYLLLARPLNRPAG
jgi:aminoglycoside N3'-acetyltransferase